MPLLVLCKSGSVLRRCNTTGLRSSYWYGSSTSRSIYSISSFSSLTVICGRQSVLFIGNIAIVGV